MSEPKIRLAVLFGGRSGEHEVSCMSAASILVSLDRDRYEVLPVRIGRDGVWASVPTMPDLPSVEEVLRWQQNGFPETGDTTPAVSILATARELTWCDVVFPALHGRYGEDGAVQTLLEGFEIPYVGSGVAASALSMDKEFTKKIAASAGLHGGRRRRAAPGAARRLPGGPRPVGTPGVRQARPRGLEHRRVQSGELGRVAGSPRPGAQERRQGAGGGGGPRAGRSTSECSNARAATSRSARRWRSCRPPSTPSSTTRPSTPTPPPCSTSPPSSTRRPPTPSAQDALRLFRELGCSGLLRVDFFLRPDGTRVINEVNTFPGFTSVSQYPRMWQAAGLDYSDLLDVLVDTALTNHRSPPLRRRCRLR